MILAAALLVLVGLGLFVGGIVTGATALYWLCVAACGAAGVFLFLARTRMGQAQADLSTSARTTAPPADAAPPDDAPAAPPVAGPVAAERSPWPPEERPPVERPTAAHAPRGTSGAADPSGEPPVEEVEVTDLLLVVDLRDEVLVVDEHPRYHVGGCRWLGGRETIPLPVDEARTDGFTPCGWCEPDRTLAERERGRRAGRRAT